MPVVREGRAASRRAQHPRERMRNRHIENWCEAIRSRSGDSSRRRVMTRRCARSMKAAFWLTRTTWRRYNPPSLLLRNRFPGGRCVDRGVFAGSVLFNKVQPIGVGAGGGWGLAGGGWKPAVGWGSKALSRCSHATQVSSGWKAGWQRALGFWIWGLSFE